MAIQANLYPENLGLPVSSQDYFFIPNNNNNMNNNNFVNNNMNNLVYNGCGLMNEFSFNNLQQKLVEQQQQQLQFQQQQQYMIQLQNMQKRNASTLNLNNAGSVFLQPSKKQKLATDPATTTTTTTVTTASTVTSESDNNNNNQNNQMSMNLSRSFSAQLEKQGMEIDRYITLQNERLRLALQEQRKQQFVGIIKKFEEKAVELVRQKDEEIAEAVKNRMEMEEIIRKLEVANEAWQRVAAEKEAMVITLNNTLEKLKEEQQLQQQQACSSSSSNYVDDAESCCNVSDNKDKNWVGVAETGENRATTVKTGKCKVCKSREACVLMLPCRHLSSCNVCDALIHACPLCKSPKKASIEALFS